LCPDVALVRHRVAIEIRGHDATVRLRIAAGATPEHVVIVDRGGLTVRGMHALPHAVVADGAIDSTELAVDVYAPKPGRYSLAIAYATDRVRWDAAYTMTTTPARKQAVLHGALAIRNTSGLALRGAAARVVDAEL